MPLLDSHIECSRHNDVEFIGDTVVKTSRQPVDLDTAQNLVDDLENYASQLEQEPINVVPLLGATVINRPDGYHVRHSTPFVSGPTMARLPDPQRRNALREAIDQVLHMSTEIDPDRLHIGIDPHVKNWKVPDDLVLVDVYPPLVRHDGKIREGTIPANYSYYERYRGTVSGVVTKMLISSLLDPSSTSRVSHAAHVIKGRLDWCNDMIPDSIPRVTRRNIQRELGFHFAPFLARTALRVAHEKIRR